MAMNKREKAALLAAQQAAALYLNPNDKVEPDMLPKDAPRDGWDGWEVNTAWCSGLGRGIAALQGVRRVWSDGHSHGSGTIVVRNARGRYHVASQQGVPLYSTRTVALRRLRWELAQEVAEALNEIDVAIAEERASVTESCPACGGAS